MRYFKYKNTGKTYGNAQKEHFLSLTQDQQRAVRRSERWNNAVLCVTVVLSAVFVGLFMTLLLKIPRLNTQWLEVLATVAKVLGAALSGLVSVLVAFVCAIPFWKKADVIIPSIKREVYAKACEHLRNYYGVQEPYIVTKCFDATDGKFKNHDVCIFVCNGELRITADLIQGFLYGQRDLGCYACRREEITLEKKSRDNRLILELKMGDAVFLLGYRAKGFIEKHLLT